jgi:CRP-like cAMP-binding protein
VHSVSPTESLHQALARHYLFSSLSPEDLGRIVASAEVRRLDKGDLLFRQGDRATHFFLVRGGHVKLYLLSPTGQEKVVDIMGPGRTFAEAVMFMQGGAFPVYAEALDAVEVVAVSNEAFRETLRHSFDTCTRLLATMSAHLHGLVGEVEGLYLHNATYRVVSFLLHEQRAGPGPAQRVRLDLPKHVLAGRLSVKPETFSRILANLRDQGLVEVHGQDIVLHDPEALRRLLLT